jgi:FixJ family two-component response regulator
MPAGLDLRVLVVDDDADTCSNLSDILELDDYRVETAGTAAEILERNDWDGVMAILLDRRLPDGNAEELLPRLRQLAPEAAILIVTGYADLQGAIAALRQGAADYILKPINPDALRASLARIAERCRLTLAKERSETAFRTLVDEDVGEGKVAVLEELAPEELHLLPEPRLGRMAHPWGLLAAERCVGNHHLRKRGPFCLYHSGPRTCRRTTCHSSDTPPRALSFRQSAPVTSTAGCRTNGT